MKELYLEVFSNVSESGICFVPLETIIVLFFYGYCDDPPLFISLVQFPDITSRPHFKIKLPKVLFEVLDEENIGKQTNLCKLPFMVMTDGVTCVAGLCSVLRQIAKIVDEKHPVLGYKQNCLYACAESSVWTRFCEVDMVTMVNNLFLHDCQNPEESHIPLDMARFEVHLEEPVRTHNIQKQRQDMARKKGIRASKSIDLEHTYSEGYQLSLADLILLPCYHLVLPLYESVQIRQLIPLTYKWYDNLMSNKRIVNSLKFMSDAHKSTEFDMCAKYSFPEIPKGSLNKGSNKGCRAKRKSFTKQEVVERCLERVEDFVSILEWQKTAFGRDVELDWSSAPLEVILEGSEFPEKRLKRKAQQLENMAKAVLKIAKPGQHIVDFCAGSGYLGLLLAHFLPLCIIILLENKEESMKRARQQAQKLDLGNVMFCHSNIDYFRGNFDIGVSLHSCGIATDLVMEKCLDRGASFVCCPCCYGAIQTNHVIEYPRSEKLRKSALTINDYLTLAHSSDQTHDESNFKTSQGRKCMAIIDIDRCLRAKECGYSVTISTLEPTSCTPKNTLLVGIPPCAG